jgi:two-component system NtrC family sensor kinase
MEGSGWKEVNLNDAVIFCIDLFQSRASEQGVGLEADLGSLLATLCQPANVNQVLLNLLANALEACAPGGKVTLRTRPVAGGAEIHVVDTGRGIDPAIRDKIFDPFFTTKPLGKGPGLGLSISHGIIQDHGGSLTFDSVPGQGSSFIIFLPRKPRELSKPRLRNS